MPNEKILIVEDDNAISSMYQIKLSQEGYKVIIAEDGASGLELAAREKPNLILLDVILPQLDGFSVLEELKKRKDTKSMSVVMLTNLGTNEDKDKAKNLGAVDYLVKSSLTPAQISETIKKYL